MAMKLIQSFNEINMLIIKQRKSFYSEKISGFTLIEVLVATIILISSIATLTLVYRGAYLSSESANKQISVVAMLPSMLARVKSEVRQLGNSSESAISRQGITWGVKYQWQATLIEYKSAPQKLDPDTGDFITPPPKYKLWQVKLLLESGSLSKQYSFKELSWNNA